MAARRALRATRARMVGVYNAHAETASPATPNLGRRGARECAWRAEPLRNACTTRYATGTPEVSRPGPDVDRRVRAVSQPAPEKGQPGRHSAPVTGERDDVAGCVGTPTAAVAVGDCTPLPGHACPPHEAQSDRSDRIADMA